ncbi:PTS system galactitol-specific EIIC component [Leminorella grimontii]|nr:PTS system galactitol-specific EIIC component [Leminorella grimontii]
MFTEIMRYVLDLGPTVMLPIVVILFSLLLKMKPGDAFKSGIHIGIGFVGIGLVIGLMLDSIGPAAKAMAEAFDINLKVVDIGWPGSSPMTWASQIALIAIPIAIVVNLVMLMTRMTRVVNVDIWNIWHMTFTGALVHIATGSYALAIVGVVVHAAFVYKLGDWFAKDTRDFFGLDGIAIPHGTSAYLGPIAVLVDTVIEKIPGLNRIHFSADDVQKRFGAFGEPVTIGFVMGLVIGLLAGYEIKAVLQLAVKTAAVMLLMPRVIKPIMDGLTPIAKQARSRLQAKFGGQDFLIGLDPALLLGHTSVVSASLIFIPLTILIAVVTPGNQVLPFRRPGDYRLLCRDGGRRPSGQPVPHPDFRRHYYVHHAVDSHTNHRSAHPACRQRRFSDRRRQPGRLNGSGRLSHHLSAGTGINVGKRDWPGRHRRAVRHRHLPDLA